MSAAELSYTFRTAYPDRLQRGRGVVVSMPVYRSGALVAPTQAGSLFSFLDPSGTAIVDEAAVTVTASIATYALTSTHLADTLAFGEGYQEVWKLILPDGTTRTVDREAAVSLRPLVPVVTDADIQGEYPEIYTLLGETQSSLQGWLDSAWKRILGRLIAEGHNPDNIKSHWSFRNPHMDLTASLFFRRLAAARKNQESYLQLAETHMAAYEAAWKGLNWTTDDDGDGRVDDPSKRRAGGSGIVHVNVPPTRHPRNVRDDRW